MTDTEKTFRTASAAEVKALPFPKTALDPVVIVNADGEIINIGWSLPDVFG
jgi:hypothetical protein